MIPTKTLTEAEEMVQQDKTKPPAVVGLMFANYPVSGVGEAFAKYYKAWNAHTAGVFNIYWVGYGNALTFTEHEKEKDDIYIVNMNPKNEDDETGVIKNEKVLNEIFERNKNSKERMYFHAGKYAQAKKEAHDKSKMAGKKDTKKNLRISEWMLLITQCKDGKILFDDTLIAINLAELKSAKSTDVINDIVLKLSDICEDEKEYKKVVKEINAYVKKKKKSSVSLKELLKKFSIEGSITANPVTGEIKVSGKVNSSK